MNPSDTSAFLKRCDVAILGGLIIDGTGAPRYSGDVFLKDGRIVAMGADPSDWQADMTLDASGCVVAPGFVDVHTHDDRAVLVSEQILPKLSQGVTTVVTGNCGLSVAPYKKSETPPPLDLILEQMDLGQQPQRYATFEQYMQVLENADLAVNVVPLVGHTSLRVQAVQDLNRPADKAETAQMRDWVEEAMQAGAWGMSSGVFYPPARAATTQELIEVGRPLTAVKGQYVTHLRDEGNQILEAMAEAFEVGRALDIRVVLSHHKVVGVANHGRSRETLAAILEAAQTQPVALDCYPYHASSTMLHPDLLVRAKRTQVTWSTPHPEMTGQMLDDIAQMWGVTEKEAAQRLVPGGAIYYAMDEQDVQAILSFDNTMIGSDGIAHDIRPHPRLWGTFPRVLGHYSRDIGLFDLETAVHKMTGLPANNFGLIDRGVLREGAWGDVVIFDPETIQDRANFENPVSPSAGIRSVLVNGKLTFTPRHELTPGGGQVLRRP